MKYKTSLIQPEQIERVILLIRGHRVMLDRDLAALYGVTTGNLNKAVQRNLGRFPPDFMFQLTPEEAEALSFHFGSLKRGQHFKYLPRVFTQKGVLRLGSLLESGLWASHGAAPGEYRPSDHGQRRFNTIASRTPAFASCSSMTGTAAS